MAAGEAELLLVVVAEERAKERSQSNPEAKTVQRDSRGEPPFRPKGHLWSIEAEQRPPGPAPNPAGSELAGSYRRHQMRCAGLQNLRLESCWGVTKRAGREPPACWTNRDQNGHGRWGSLWMMISPVVVVLLRIRSRANPLLSRQKQGRASNPTESLLVATITPRPDQAGSEASVSVQRFLPQ